MPIYNMARWAPVRSARLRGLSLAGIAAIGYLLLTSPGLAQNQPGGQYITPNYKNADIGQVIEAVSAITGKNFIVDPRVKAQVTMISNNPLSPEAFYETFLSILQVYGFIAVPSGDVIKILPNANARQMPSVDLPADLPSGKDEMVTQVIHVRNVNAAQLVPILRPLIPQYGHLAAHPESNMLIISDRSANVARMARIIGRMDQAGDAEVDIIPLSNASALEVVRVVTSLYQAGRGGDAKSGLGLVADERTNSVLVSGDRNTRLRLRALIIHLDNPLEQGGKTRVRYLRYASAEELAPKLSEHVSGTQVAAGAPGAGAPRKDEKVTIWAEEQTNALVITAPQEVMTDLMAIIDKLDIRRAQVAVETILVSMRADRAADLGITWAIADDDFGAGTTTYTNTGLNIAELIGAIAGGAESDVISALPAGVIAGVGTINESGTSWAVLLRALARDVDSNIIATPNIVTLDNEEAEITVAQEVPFRTGEFTSAGGSVGVVNPFTTIQRKDVGIVLKITPQINEGDTIMLKIDQEASNIARAVSGATDIITDKRTIRTNVMVEDDGVVVMGGLTQNTLLESKEQVPVMGSVPLIGELFRSRSTTYEKQNLMLFIHPKILRSGTDYALETDSKYRYMRRLQQEGIDEGVSLMPTEERLVLPGIDFSKQIKEGEIEGDITATDPETGTTVTTDMATGVTITDKPEETEDGADESGE